MADDPKQIESARTAFNTARGTSESGRTDFVLAAEKVKHLERELARVSRSGDKNAIANAKDQLEAARKLAGGLRGSVTQNATSLADALSAWAAFTNPITAVERLPDDTPIALFPLRLETRYRTISPAIRLFCVRVFPDDALVDTFQPEIAETELVNVTNYWVHRWRAGGDAAGHKAAWAALVRASGAGRAKWLIDQVKPTSAEPVLLPGEHLLVITPSAPVPAAEHAEIDKFWKRIWSTSGLEHDDAFGDLKNALGGTRALEIESTLVPVNLLDTNVPPSPSLTPRVVFLDLPQRDTLPMSEELWTRGARAWLLPERLVLLGFRDGVKVLEKVGEPIPADLQIGPDPAAPDDEQIEADGADMKIPEALRWTVDFGQAVKVGMAFAVPIDQGQQLPTFDRLFVLGVRVGSTAEESAEELSRLITNHQSSRKGFSLLPQGRATNNTDAATAGHSWWEDPDDSFRHFFELDPNDDPTEWQRRKDGAWLAGMLGIDPDVLKPSPYYFGTDQAEARAMNVALWPATLGYYMEQMLEPVFSEDNVRDTRAFFNRFVIGRGTVPLIRIGKQPYGILPTTVWSRMHWWNNSQYIEQARLGDRPDLRYLESLSDLIDRGVGLWNSQANGVPNAGGAGQRSAADAPEHRRSPSELRGVLPALRAHLHALLQPPAVLIRAVCVRREHEVPAVHPGRSAGASGSRLDHRSQ